MYKWSPIEVISTLTEAGSILTLSISGKLPCTSQVRVYAQAGCNRHVEHSKAESAHRGCQRAAKPFKNDKTMTASQCCNHRMASHAPWLLKSKPLTGTWLLFKTVN